jgi:hypothetical protein
MPGQFEKGMVAWTHFYTLRKNIRQFQRARRKNYANVMFLQAYEGVFWPVDIDMTVLLT